MKAAELRASILQEAVSGKLVPQIASEGTADELLKQIEAERAALIKAGKIKKEKPLPEITEDEVPFEIPKSWKWVRLGDIILITSGKRVFEEDWKSQGVPFYRAREVAVLSEIGKVNNELFISEELYQKLKDITGVPQKDDLLVTGVGTLGKVYCVNDNDKFYFKDASILWFKNYAHLESRYISYLFQSSFIKNQIKETANGTTVDTLTIVNAKNILFPLPSLSEQKRIVAKLEELLPLIDQYAEEEDKLSVLSAQFPDAMRKSILQEAVSGKLVPQIASEGTADELLKQIETERAALIKAGKIKNEKPLPEITEEEIPFEIPKSWTWVRLGNIGFWRAGGTPNRSNQDYFKNGNIPWIKSGDLNDGDIYSTEEKITKLAVDNSSAKIIPVNSVVLAMYGATIGRTGILKIEATTNQACCSCTAFSGIDNKYLQFYLLSQKQDLIDLGWGSAQPNISREIIVSYSFPLPPLSEQKRIVAKIEELMGIIDKIKA